MSETLNTVVNSAQRKLDKSINLNSWLEFENLVETFRYSKNIYLAMVFADAEDDIAFLFGSRKTVKKHLRETTHLHFHFMRNIGTEFHSHMFVIHVLKEEIVSTSIYCLIFFPVLFYEIVNFFHI